MKRDAPLPTHNAKAILHLHSVPKEKADALITRAPLQDDPVKIGVGMLVNYVQLDEVAEEGTDKRVVRVHGPHDVLRWLADEVDAGWT